jgi:hypothetical protein
MYGMEMLLFAIKLKVLINNACYTQNFGKSFYAV